MVDYHVVFGAVSVVIALVGYVMYVRSMFKDGTKPHPITWLLFVLIDGTVFFAQVLNNGGPGAWTLGFAACMNGIVFLLAIRKGEKHIVILDWICFATALLGIAVWVTTSNALFAVLLASGADILAKIPTFRKAYLRPYEESLTIWSFDLAKFSLSIVALSSITLTTALLPAEIIFVNLFLIAMILLRRQKLGRVST